MGRNFSTTVKKGIFGTTWKSDIEYYTNEFRDISSIEIVKIFLPYVIKISDEDKEEIRGFHIDEKIYKDLKLLNKKDELYYVTLFLRKKFNKYELGIELSANVQVIPQRMSKKPGYYYKWDERKRKLKITKILGTYNTDKIEKMIYELINEFKRFYYMYCKTKLMED